MAIQFLGTRFQSLKDDGTVNASGTVQFYEPGTSTPKQTYSDSSLDTPNADPVQLDASGSAHIWYSGNADVVVYDSDAVEIDTASDINPEESSQWIEGPVPTYVSGTSFTLTGDQTSTFHVGRRIYTVNTGGTIYSTISASAYTSLTTITVVNDSGTLDSGLSEVSYGILSATNSSLPGTIAHQLRFTQASPFTFEGTTDDAYETTVAITDPTADRTLTVQDQTGTISICDPVVANSRNLLAYNNATNPNYQIDLTADSIVLENSGGNSLKISTWSLTADITASGANGLDTGAEGSSTWYYLWAIYDGTNKRGLISASATSPTLPTGYTYKALVAAWYNDGSSNFRVGRQIGKKFFYTSEQNVLSGGTATTETAITISAHVPTIATEFRAGIRCLSDLANARSTIFRVVTSLNYCTLNYGHSSTANIQNDCQYVFPNISQTLYYIASGSNTQNTVDIHGYEIA